MMNNQVNMMGNNGSPTSVQKVDFKKMLEEIPQEYKNLYFGFMACIAVIIIGCFLPLYKALGIKINYVMNDGRLAGGVFLIILGVCAVAMLLWKKKPLVSLVCQAISALLFINQWFKLQDAFKEANSYTVLLGSSYKATYSIGFWVILIGIVGSLVCIGLIVKKEKESAPQTIQSQPSVQQSYAQPVQANPQPAVQTNCPYCGTPRTQGSPFCSNCGAKID